MQVMEWLKRSEATTEQRRVEAVVKTLANVHGPGESLAAVAHDARNMVTALGLYCDLLEEPGVLAVPFAHYSSELRLVAAASRRLVEKLVALDADFDAGGDRNLGGQRRSEAVPLPDNDMAPAGWPERDTGRAQRECVGGKDRMPAFPIANLASELLANRNLLAALAGPGIAVTVEAEGGARPVRMTGEDLTRVLVNLVKNAAEAMPRGGRIRIRLSEQAGEAGGAARLAIAVEDDGPGIPERVRERVFEPGYTTRAETAANGAWPVVHRGLGLAISRSIVEAAGGRLIAAHRGAPGARFEMVLPAAGEIEAGSRS